MIGRMFWPMVFGAALCAATVSAGEKVLKNDSVQNTNANVLIQKGFIQGDIGAAILSASASEYPVRILEAQVLMKDRLNSQAQRLYILHVYPTSSPGIPVYSLGVALREGFLNTVDLRPQNLVMNGPFTIGFEVFDTPVPAEPNLCTDADGCQSGKNLIYDINTRLWFPACFFQLSGDLVIRARVETNFGQSATVTSASTPRIGSTVVMNLNAASGAGLRYQAASSFGNAGIPIGTRSIPLSWDPLVIVSLFTPAPIFLNYAGALDAGGSGTALMNVPNVQALVGTAFYTAFLTLDAGSPNGVKHISNGLKLTFTP